MASLVLDPTSRVDRALAHRAAADVAAGLPMQSENPVYGNAYIGARILAGVEAGSIIVVAVEQREPGGGCIGVIGLAGEGSTKRDAEFIDIAHLREAVALGVQLVDTAGEDVTHIVSPIQ